MQLWELIFAFLSRIEYSHLQNHHLFIEISLTACLAILKKVAL